MGVDVDESGEHESAGDVHDGVRRTAVDAPDVDDLITVDGHVRAHGTVRGDHRAAAQHATSSHRSPQNQVRTRYTTRSDWADSTTGRTRHLSNAVHGCERPKCRTAPI